MVKPQTRMVSVRERIGQQRLDVGGAGLIVHRDQRHQHQHRAEEGVEEELEGGVDPVLAAPDADDQEHRDQLALEEDVEEHQIQRAEDAEHQRLQHQEGDHILLDPAGDAPARGDGQRHQEGGQHHEQDRDAVDAHPVGKSAEPRPLLDELEAGVARVVAGDQKQRQEESGAGGEEREELGVPLRHRVLALQEDEQHHRADQRQEGDEREQAVHRPPPAMPSQSVSTTSPSTIAKA